MHNQYIGASVFKVKTIFSRGDYLDIPVMSD